MEDGIFDTPDVLESDTGYLGHKRSPFRILHIIEGGGGGAVSHVLTLAQKLNNRGIDCFVAFLSGGPSIPVAEQTKVPFVLIPKRFLLDPMPIVGLIRFIADKRITIVHTHTIRGNYYGRLASVLHQRFLINITTVHSHVLDELRGEQHFGLKERLLVKRESRLWSFVDHFICVSKKLRGRLLSSGISAQRASVVENAVEIPDSSAVETYQESVRREFGIKDGETIVGTIGRLVPLKNQGLFIESAKEIAERTTGVRFFVVGDGPLLLSLMNQAEAIGISDAMVFTGWRQDVQRLMSAFDVYVICSLVEGLNLSVLEAMACGKPVVGTDVKGISEIVVHQRTGILVPSNDVRSLTKAILELIRDEKRRGAMGSHGKQMVSRHYAVDKMVLNTLAIYRKTYVEKQNTR